MFYSAKLKQNSTLKTFVLLKSFLEGQMQKVKCSNQLNRLCNQQPTTLESVCVLCNQQPATLESVCVLCNQQPATLESRQ